MGKRWEGQRGDIAFECLAFRIQNLITQFSSPLCSLPWNINKSYPTVLLFKASFYSTIACWLDSSNVELVICIIIHYAQQFLSRKDLKDHLVIPILRSSFYTSHEERIWQTSNKGLKDGFFSIVLCTNQTPIANESYLILETDLMVESSHTELWSKPEVDPGTFLLTLSTHLPLCQSDPGRKHIAYSKESAKGVWKGTGRVKGTYKGWWSTTSNRKL